MLRIFFIAILFGGAAMAKDGSIEIPRSTAPIDPVEEFFKSDQGRDIERLFNDFTAGKKTYDEVYDEYHQKWTGRPSGPMPPAQVPDAPLTPIR